MASLYVGDLHPEVTEAMIFEKFSQAGPVLSIRVCRDMITRKSLGYAYVNFQQPADAERARFGHDELRSMKGRPIRIMWSQRDPSLRKSGQATSLLRIWTSRLTTRPCSTHSRLWQHFVSCKIANDETGNSPRLRLYSRGPPRPGYREEWSTVCFLAGKKVFVGPFVPRKERHSNSSDKKFTNVFVKNFGDELTEESFHTMFSEFGEIHLVQGDTRLAKAKDLASSASRSQSRPKARRIRAERQGDQRQDSLRRPGPQKKGERQAELREKIRTPEAGARMNRYQTGVNLYVKNLDDTIDDEKLKAEFASFGNITSAKVR
uniref:RRM domain-containing protein n=1 Tax=Macrostomum lignano TaxID=282301 RepID=A0A1I8F205_9PLAT